MVAPSDRPTVFETARLVARDWSPADAPGAFEQFGDPEVTRYLGMEPVPDVETMRRRLEHLIERNGGWPEGYGSYPLFLKSDGRLVGTAILKILPGAEDEPTGDVEIGWHLSRRAWGRGYATEAGAALLELGFVRLGLDRLHAVVESPNERSLKVARRLGMRHVGRTTKYYGARLLELFVLDRAEWEARRTP